ncbi:MAG: YybH family protein [Planctomycetota bacterium]|jgi:beta-aspartyl-peptidase (threonine type)
MNEWVRKTADGRTGTRPGGSWVIPMLLACHITGCNEEVDLPAMQRGEIREVITDQEHFWNAGDIEGFMEAYWDSARLSFNSDGKLERGWEKTMERFQRRYPDRDAMGHLKFDQLEINELGDSAAYVLGRWYIRRDVPIGGTFTLVFQKMDDEWKIVHDHTSVAEQEE